MAFLLASVAAGAYERWQPDPREGTASELGQYVRSTSAPFVITALVGIALILAISYRWLSRRTGTTDLLLTPQLSHISAAALPSCRRSRSRAWASASSGRL